MRRSAGFTIVEILVALGIMGVVTLAAMSLLNFSNIGMKDIFIIFKTTGPALMDRSRWTSNCF